MDLATSKSRVVLFAKWCVSAGGAGRTVPEQGFQLMAVLGDKKLPFGESKLDSQSFIYLGFGGFDLMRAKRK